LQKGAADDLANKASDAGATKVAMLGYTRLLQNQKQAAAEAAQSALANSKMVKIRFLSGRTFVGAGEIARAQTVAAELGSEVQSEPQAYAKIIQGEVTLSAGDPRKAI